MTQAAARADGDGQSETTPALSFLWAIVAAVFLSVVTSSMIYVAAPVIAVEFAASPAGIAWVFTGFSLAYGIGVPLYGGVADRLGIRPVFAFGLVLFAAGGLVCALAPDLAIMIAGRIVQATGGAAVPALASVVVIRTMPAGSRGSALGMLSSSAGIGASVGPIVGGAVTGLLGWRALFAGSLVLTLLLVPFAWRALPTDSADSNRRFDLPGGILLGLAAGFLLFAITGSQQAASSLLPPWGSVVVATIAGTAFVWRINRANDPFVSPALFANRAYIAALLVGLLAMAANLSALVFAAMLMIEVNGLSPGMAGLALTPGAVAIATLSPVAGRLSDRLGARRPVLAGLTVMVLSLLMISSVGAGGPAALVAIGLLGIGVGFAFVQSPLTNAAASVLSQAEAGAGMGVYSGAFFLGAAIGPALAGAALAVRSEVGMIAFNPVYALHAAPFSDVFLIIAVAPLAAMIAALGLSR